MERDLTSGSVGGNMLRFSLPYFLSYFLQMLYGMADLFIIGQFCGVEATTAVSIGSQVMHFVTVIIVGLAMGSTVLIGRSLGAGDRKAMNLAVGNTITIFIAVSLIFTGILLASGRGIIGLLSTPEEAVDGTLSYLKICFLGVPMITAYNIVSSVLRGMGDSRSPMIFIAIACVINILLDYLFIGSFGMGPAGAALGTTVSQSCSVVISISWILLRRSGGTETAENSEDARFTASCLRPRGHIMKSIFTVGGPVAVQDGFIQVAFLILTMIANMRGLTDAAAVGVVEKLISIFFLVPSTMMSTVSVMSAQNLGAGKNDRAKRSLFIGIGTVVCFGLIMSVLVQFTAEDFVGIFTSDRAVILAGGTYIRSYIWDCIVAGIHFCFSGYFVACGLSVISFAHNVASICLRIPLAWLLSVSYPDTLFPMGCSTPAGSLLSCIICLAAYRWLQSHPDRIVMGS